LLFQLVSVKQSPGRNSHADGGSKAEKGKMKLHENLWWPGTWETKNRQNIPRDEIRQYGILTTCEMTNIGLMIRVDCRGREVSGRVPWPSLNSPGNLTGLRDFLLDYTGDSVATVEDLDVTPDQFNTR
jgi:hypothetical protein